MATNFGIFIRSTKSNDDIIEACNNLMKHSNLDGRILTVRSGKTYGGVKVFLNGDAIVQELLEKQFLYETGDDLSTIHPLRTHLTVHDAIISSTEEEFIEELRNIIQEALGPVLKISKIPFSKQYPDIGNGNWRVLLDVPEIEDLDIFKKSGLPDDFTIKVPGVHGRLSVTFYCTKCDKDGHTQWRCPRSLNDNMEDNSESLKEEDSTANTPKRSMSGFFIRDRDEESKESKSAPKTKPLLKRKRIEEFEKEIGKEEVRNFCDSFQLKNSSNIKKEVGESSSSTMTRPVRSENDDIKRETHAKRARFSPMNEDDSQPENIPKASSTTDDANCLEILFESSPSTSKNQPHYVSSESGALFTRNSVDDSVSTSNEHLPTADIKSDLPSTDENDSDSNLGPSASRSKPVRQRKKPAQDTPIVIPDRIQKIISEIDDGVLGVEPLTAFFNHVKKKSKPCSFAEMYTSNVAGLKKQLDEIKRRYYMIPERGTKEEIQFMKWFVNIINRFDGTPNTRKRKVKT
ncbi:uncharacterized protein LOC129966110 [Argiope bruennichi]|uniref:uncharacterized protein LOC129966110 n=1 Tax=Argiope bruennichi TaxID=94029 RepID=UPI002493DC82|nr:uncharacterized protein LOC129966110 [Argiope bruennichi]